MKKQQQKKNPDKLTENHTNWGIKAFDFKKASKHYLHRVIYCSPNVYINTIPGTFNDRITKNGKEASFCDLLYEQQCFRVGGRQYTL